LMLKTRTSTLSEMSFHLNKAILFKEASFEWYICSSPSIIGMSENSLVESK
jgi:hypothetical protein